MAIAEASKPFDIVVEAGRAERQYWRDLFRFRELFLILAWRDVAVRYKQTILGVAWILFRPLITVAVLTFVFGNLSKLPSDGVPYPLVVMAAMLAWQLFSSSLSSACTSLLGNSNLISKVYFPRLIIPFSSVAANMVDFGITLILTFAIMAYYGYLPGPELCLLPLFLVLLLMCSGGMGLWLAALNVRYRDVGHIIPFLVQFGLYLSPVGFLTTVVPEQWRLLFAVNPVVGIVDGFRWCLLGSNLPPYWPGVGLSVLTSSLFLVSGIWYFRRTERTFADLV